jgi:hypothetical protein
LIPRTTPAVKQLGWKLFHSQRIGKGYVDWTPNVGFGFVQAQEQTTETRQKQPRAKEGNFQPSSPYHHASWPTAPSNLQRCMQKCLTLTASNRTRQTPARSPIKGVPQYPRALHSHHTNTGPKTRLRNGTDFKMALHRVQPATTMRFSLTKQARASRKSILTLATQQEDRHGDRFTCWRPPSAAFKRHGITTVTGS